MDRDPGSVTRLLSAAAAGDKESLKKATEVVYEDLRQLAARFMRRERPDHTLGTTGLVHEAYLRLVDQNEVDWKSRQHFFAIAAKMMRRILVNHARDRKAQKRGGERERVPLEEGFLPDDLSGDGPRVDLVDLDDALKKLEAEDPQLARVVEMRFFAGMPIEEIAQVLEVAPRTVKRYWKAARILLLDALGGEGG
jgi:RNA polymerase sigma factor (TIGR02999 family)